MLCGLLAACLPARALQKAEYRQESYRKSLNAKLELHGLLQEVLQERLARRAVAAEEAAEASSAGAAAAAAADGAAAAAKAGGESFETLMAELDAVRTGRSLPAATVLKVAQLFRDEITVDNLPRGQLAALAKYAGLSPFAPEPLLRMQLRLKLKAIKEVRGGGCVRLPHAAGFISVAAAVLPC